MSWRRADRLVSLGILVYALVLYGLTVAPTASFWDAGEFIAIAHGLQVSHPPGAPFYMLVGRLFSMFAPDAFISLSVNLVSVIASAVTVLLTHWIIVRLIREFSADKALAMFGGIVGACTYAVTDSFWFNAVEAEVYAMSMLFTALVVWLIMRWSEDAKQELAATSDTYGLGANRYLVLVAYLFGLAIGVHLLSLLAVFFIALIFFFVEYDRPEWTAAGTPDWKSPRRWGGIFGALAVATVGFLVVYPGVVQWLPDIAGRSGSPLLTLLAVLMGAVILVAVTQRKRMQLANLAALSLLMVLIGYSTYALIFIRSAADPPIDENDPETPAAFVSYLKREQYGETPLLKGLTYDNRTGQFTSSEVLFPRRYSISSQHQREYARYSSDLDFFWRYQIGHMYVRYFLFNFSGRESDFEDSRAITGFSFIDGEYEHFLETPSERASRNKYYALPLLLGLFGMLYHFSRDWRRAFCVLILFLVTGIGIILYLNQTPMQPRERDYSYVASFFAFSFWIGIGATGLMATVRDYVQRLPSAFRRGGLGLAVVVVCLAVPVHMMIVNYDDHDRSGRYAAPDFAHNMLMSVAPNAVLLTNGDNDTFPLWYLQEVEGVRRDVRVANLSLLNTPWYVRQLKHQWSRESEPLPIGMTDDQIAGLEVQLWSPQTVMLPGATAVETEFSEVSAGEEEWDDSLSWMLTGRPYTVDPQTNEPVNLLYGADIAVLDMIATNALTGWRRPIYFAVTVASDGRLDLDDYLQLEGQAQRVVPRRHDEPMGRIDPHVSPLRLNEYRFTNLDDPSVYYDANIRRMVDNYRNIFAQTAMGLIEAGYSEEGAALMDTVLTRVPFETIPGDYSSYLYSARTYLMAGRSEQSVEILKRSESRVLHDLANGQSQQLLEQYIFTLRSSYIQARDYEAAADFENRIAGVLGEAGNVTADELRRQVEGMFSGEDTVQASQSSDTSSIGAE